MNIQENAYQYYALMVELYAKKHNISREEVLSLFSKYLVYENIVSQSDIWGHFNFNENLDYIENKLLNDDKRQMLVFHGTTCDFDQIDLNKCQGCRDFGKGFYTTVIYDQASAWAKRNARRSLERKAYVYTFMYDYWKNDDLKIKEFLNCSKDWLDFVLLNRKSELLKHDYDIVRGPVADDDISETLDLLERGIINEDDALNRLSYKKTSNQISFHTTKGVECLVLIEKENK